MHANVFIRLASAFDEISFFKFFFGSCCFLFFYMRKKKIIHRALSLSRSLLESVALSHIFYWNEREKIEDNMRMFRYMCCQRQMSLTSPRPSHQESVRLDNGTLSRTFFSLSIKNKPSIVDN